MPDNLDERGLFISLLILFPTAVLECAYYTRLIWPFLATQNSS